MPHPDIPQEALEKEREPGLAVPEINPWACITLLTTAATLMAKQPSLCAPCVPSLIDCKPLPAARQ
jgi:hypothetical protein